MQTPRPSSAREPAYDTLRGVLLVVMGLNHIPSFLYWLTQQPFGHVTAAEGFIFLAGLMVGKIYSKKWLNAGASMTSGLLLKRCRTIYFAHLASIVGVLLWMFFYQQVTGKLPFSTPWILLEQPWPLLLNTALLIYQPGLFDILPMYCGFLLLSPLILKLFISGHALRVLAASMVVWLLTNLFLQPLPYANEFYNTGAFHFTAWQLLFVLGKWIGYRQAIGLPALWLPNRLQIILCLACVIFLSATSHGWITLGISKETWFSLSNKTVLPPLRVLNTCLVFILVACAVRRWPTRFSIPFFSVMGRNSLAVFSVHSLAVSIMLGFPQFFDWPKYGNVLGPIVLVSILFLTAIIADRFKKKVPQRVKSKDVSEPDFSTQAQQFSSSHGMKLPYQWIEPTPSNNNARYPLVLFLHGSGERGNDNISQMQQGMPDLLVTMKKLGQSSFLLAPQCPTEIRWRPIDKATMRPISTPDENLLLDALEELVTSKLSDPRIDPSRFYLTGISMGGYGTWELLRRNRLPIAAAMPICGAGIAEDTTAFAEKPIWIFHGEMDSVVPALFSQEMAAALRHAKLTLYPNVGHDSWAKTYQNPEVIQWLFNQRLLENGSLTKMPLG
ncbi:MAG: hypothetical protein EAZ42_03615 [Verrucomicrobia bacterium]|nr:MAG: hypothetical protein EAZ42_03615 [Verrucomicrobiota bacterium]